MATFKATVRTPRKDGFYQVYIRVVHNTRPGYSFSECRIREDAAPHLHIPVINLRIGIHVVVETINVDVSAL